MRQQPDYGIDSPAMIVGELLLGGVAFGVALVLLLLHAPYLWGFPLWGISVLVGLYLVLNAIGMLFYSKVGKYYIRDHLLSGISWHGDELVLDVGCGRGLLLVGAARRLTCGRAIGVDRWIRGAISGNRPEAVLQNAALEGVADRVQVQDGDARHLPFDDDSFDVVVSNFVIHEMDTRADREQMLREVVRVLKPGGQIALVDFIFTGQAVRMFKEGEVSDARRLPMGRLYFWFSAITSLGLVRVYLVMGRKVYAAFPDG